MNKQTKIDAIERRILDEHRKYFQHDSPVEWAKIAAIKIYSMFKEPESLYDDVRVNKNEFKPID